MLAIQLLFAAAAFVGGLLLLVKSDSLGPTLVGVFLLILGCSFIGRELAYEHSFTRREPKPEDLVGTYNLDNRTEKLVLKRAKTAVDESSITLRPDRSIEIRNIPRWRNENFGSEISRFDSQRGRWSLQKVSDRWLIDIETAPQHGGLPGPAQQNGFDKSMFILGEKPPYKIYIMVGDGDDEQGMQFQKKS